MMGEVSVCADRLGLSIRERTVFASSVAKSLGADIEDTNISVQSAWRRGREVREKKAKEIKSEFNIPTRSALHWDGKTLKIRAGQKSSRVCVYLSGADSKKVKKLLGVPEVQSGTGHEESDNVIKTLEEWHVEKEAIIALVFDTTHSNSGINSGACLYVERYLNRAVLWCACHHHCYELHLKHAMEVVWGVTKDPGVSLFRMLKNVYHELDIDTTQLVVLNKTNLPLWMQEESNDILR